MRTLGDYKHGDYEAINLALASVNWSELLDDDTVGCWNNFTSLLHWKTNLSQLRESIGRLTVKKPLWMPKKLLTAVCRKRKVFRKYKNINHPAVKSACIIARLELRRSRHNYEYKLDSSIQTHTHTTVLRLCGICPGQPG